MAFHAETAVVSLRQNGSLEERLLVHNESWRRELCSAEGPNGCPIVLTLASSAVTANNLAKQFSKASKVETPAQSKPAGNAGHKARS